MNKVKVMIVTVMEEPHGVYASSSRDGASRTEEDAEIDRQLGDNNSTTSYPENGVL